MYGSTVEGKEKSSPMPAAEEPEKKDAGGGHKKDRGGKPPFDRLWEETINARRNQAQRRWELARRSVKEGGGGGGIRKAGDTIRSTEEQCGRIKAVKYVEKEK